MIDDEPFIGRNTGILDLQRISLANIERIEITKGPDSALYRSDALAGTINVITTEPKPGTHGNIYSRYS